MSFVVGGGEGGCGARWDAEAVFVDVSHNVDAVLPAPVVEVGGEDVDG